MENEKSLLHPYEDELTAVKAESFFFFRLRLLSVSFTVLVTVLLFRIFV